MVNKGQPSQLNKSDSLKHEQILELFNFEVNKFPLMGPDNMTTPHYGLFRSDTGESVGETFRAGYVPHTTDDILAIYDAVRHVFGDCSIKATFKDGHILYLGPSDAERRIIAGGISTAFQDGIFPMMKLLACYNGQAFRFNMGWYRDLCANLSRLKSIKEVNTIIRHTAALRGKMDELIRQMSGIKNGWETLTQHIDRMASIQTPLDEFLKHVVGDRPEKEGSAQTRWDNRIAAIFRRVAKEHQIMGLSVPSEATGYKVSVWEAFNGVQGYIQHDKSRRNGLVGIDRTVIADEDPMLALTETYSNKLVLAAAA